MGWGPLASGGGGPSKGPTGPSFGGGSKPSAMGVEESWEESTVASRTLPSE
jgi:hypothetical protein